MASTAEALRTQLDMESPFNDEEVTDESEIEEAHDDEIDESDESETGEESEESESESESEEPDEEDEEKLSQVNENLNRALKEERGLRQEAQSKIDELTKNSEMSQSLLDDAEATIESIKDQLKELDMEDLITIKGKVDPEVKKLMTEKQASEQQKKNAEELQKFNRDMISEVNKSVADFNNIDLKNDDQGILLQSMIYMATLAGMPLEDAVKQAMERVDRTLSSTLKKRTPAVKPKKKLRSVSKTVKTTKNLTPLERIRMARESQK